MEKGSIKVRLLVGRFTVLALLVFLLGVLALAAFVKIDEKVYADGYIVARDDEDVRAPFASVLKSVLFLDGATVAKGDLMAELDDTEVRGRYERAQKELAKAESDHAAARNRRQKLEIDPLPEQLRFTRVALERAELDMKLAESEWQTSAKLAKDGLVSEREVEKLKTRFELSKKDVEIAKERAAIVAAGLSKASIEEAVKNEESALRAVEMAKAECQRIQTELERRLIRAPVSGKVIWSRLHPGEAVKAGDLLFTIQSSDRLELRVFVIDELVAKVAPGQPVRIYSQAYSYTKYGFAYGKVMTVSSSGESQNGRTTYLVRIAVDETPMPLPISSRATARIVVNRRTIFQMLFDWE